MLQIRKIMIRGLGVADAIISFESGANILAGASDTGKSYLLHCLDYIFGADAMKKRIPQAESYSQLFVEFANTDGNILTLERSLSGGDLAAHDTAIEDIDGDGEKIAARRYGKSTTRDVTSVLFSFAGIAEAKLRKNDRGAVQRLTIRTFIPVFLIDEISVIDERSPVIGDAAFDATARRRMFAYMLSGKDDEGIIAAERKDIVRARFNAQLGIVSNLLEPLERRLQLYSTDDPNDAIDDVDENITALTQTLSKATDEQMALYQERREAASTLQRAESQLLAIDELLNRYRLLDGRYGSDLDRLDFIAEGAHFFDSLQEVRCPLCDQPMTPEHTHTAKAASAAVYDSARAEAAKILAHRVDLTAAIESLTNRRHAREKERTESVASLKRIENHINSNLEPTLQRTTAELGKLIERRVELEAVRSERDQADNLRSIREELERASVQTRADTTEWESLPSSALRRLCVEIEAILKEWSWKGECRVEFDQIAFDIVVDGQTRQSHGKGVRAVLYSAFAIGLLRYCQRNGRPHPGVVVIDSPLTSYKKGRVGSLIDGPVDAGIEAAFWKSLMTIKDSVQVIIVENKEPPADVAAAVHYEWFAGENAQRGERVGFIPAP